MKYFRNTELANLYHVSEKTVRNWIEAAQSNKLDLQLFENNNKFFIANTPQNNASIKKLVEKGKKYKNRRGALTISPLPSFYTTYGTRQIVDIISNITIHRELPLQYNYVDGGAEYWDQYAKRLAREDVPNILTNTIDLLDSNLDALDRLVNGHKKINIIDLGPGNGLPVKRLLSHFLQQGRLNRYIGIDISQEILDITQAHIQQWFGNKITFEGYVRDFGSERFDDLFADDYTGDDEDIPLNIVLLLSGTICNFRSPGQALLAINNSLSPNDLLVYTTKLDTPNTRRYFDLGLESRPNPRDYLFHFLIDKMNLPDDSYELDQTFDEVKMARSISLRPTIDLSIQFDLLKGTRVIHLNKNEPVLVWRYWHFGILDVIHQFDQGGFNLVQVTKSREQECMLLISQIKTGS